MTYYVIKFVWKDSNNFIQTAYVGSCDFNEAKKFDNIEAAKTYYKKYNSYFKFITKRKNSATYISKIVINIEIEDVEKI